jgi:methyl-accepting chemotaxis protein
MIFILLTRERKSTIESTRNDIENLSEMISVSAHFTMSQGVTDIHPFVEKFRSLQNFTELRLTPADIIKTGSEKSMDKAELEVLKSAKTNSYTEDFKGKEVYRIIKPILSDESCSSCHAGKPGEPLAIISLRYSLADLKENLAGQTGNALLLGLATIIFTFFVAMYFNRKMIVIPIKKVLSIIQELTKGHVKVRSGFTSNDEIGAMAINVDKLAEELETFAGLMFKVSEGDLTAQIKAVDSEDALAPALNSISIALNGLIEETRTLTASAIEGKLDNRGNSAKFKGSYREIIDGFNRTLDAVITPLNMAADYVYKISEGKIPDKITSPYYGQFNIIKNNLNTCIDAINRLVGDAETLSNAALHGNFTTRADVAAHAGDFAAIVKGVNDTLDTVVDKVFWYEGLLDSIPMPISVTDMDKNWTFINKPVEDFLKIKRSDILGKQCSNWNAEVCGTENCGINGLKKGKARTRFAQQGINFQVDTSYVLNRRGEKIGHIEVIQDITRAVKTTEYSRREVERLALNLKKLAEGNLKLDLTVDEGDEYTKAEKENFTKINLSLEEAREAIYQLVEDAESLTYTALEGNLSARANSSKHKGEFAVIVDGINKTLDAVINPIQAAADYMNNISRGIIPEPITEEYKGDFNNIKTSINELISTMNRILTGVKRISGNIQNGNLNDRARASHFVGEWKTLLDQINSIVEILVYQVRFMAGNINDISKGNIPEKITSDFNGDYNEIKNNLNICFDSIKALINDMYSLSSSASEGRLSDRADAAKHQGDFRKIVEGVNETIEGIITPIREGVKTLENMARGDLTVRMTGNYKGDHQLIKNSINTVCESLSKALGDVSSAITATASASNEISASTEEMALGAARQKEQTSEVAFGVEEMTKTILDNTKNASFASDTAKLAGQKAIEGGKVVEETIKGMQRIEEVVLQSAKTVQLLGNSSEQIGEIVQVINDIADQTNLLALNAAIEAARAGEQGRGFAVVADEVRKLAERTTKATKEIAGMIKRIQTDTMDAVESMNKGTAEVENGKAMANKAGESLNEIVRESQRVLDLVSQVAAASEQQSASAEVISKNIEAISAVTQESAGSTQQIAQSAEDLNRLTLNLENLIAKFKIENDNQAFSVNENTRRPKTIPPKRNFRLSA